MLEVREGREELAGVGYGGGCSIGMLQRKKERISVEGEQKKICKLGTGIGY